MYENVRIAFAPADDQNRVAPIPLPIDYCLLTTEDFVCPILHL